MRNEHGVHRQHCVVLAEASEIPRRAPRPSRSQSNSPLINRIVPQREQLLQQLIRPVDQRVMVQHVRHKRLAAADPRRRLAREVEIDIHVLDERGRVHGHLVRRQPRPVVQRRPVREAREPVRDVAEAAQLVEVGEHGARDRLAGEEDGVVVGPVGGEAGEVGVVRQAAVGGPVGGGPLGVDGLVQQGVQRGRVEGDHGAEGGEGGPGEEAGLVQVAGEARDHVVHAVHGAVETEVHAELA